MSKITCFDKTNLNLIRKDAAMALQVVADKYGIVFDLGKITYSNEEFNMKLEAKVDGAKTLDDKMLDLQIASYNLNLTSKCGNYKLVGYRQRASKSPYIIADKQGKQFICSLSHVQRNFGK